MWFVSLSNRPVLRASLLGPGSWVVLGWVVYRLRALGLFFLHLAFVFWSPLLAA